MIQPASHTVNIRGLKELDKLAEDILLQDFTM